jgi:hypothetical protein
MSRTDVYRALAAIVAVASLVSCNSKVGDQNVSPNQAAGPSQALGGYPGVVGYADAVGPIHINFTCDTTPPSIPSLSLADANGNPAWTVKAKKKDPISWEVPANVTIDSIVSKNAIPLPLDSAGPQGGGPGIPYSSKVKDSNKPPTDYHYNIFAKCNPTDGAPVLRLKIDPEMIIP